MDKPFKVKLNQTLYLDYDYGTWDPDHPRDFRGIPFLKYGEDYEYMHKGTKLTVYTEPQDIEKFVDKLSLNVYGGDAIAAIAIDRKEQRWISFSSIKALDSYPYFDAVMTKE